MKSEAGKIVDECIAVHGGEHYDNVLIRFDFRGRTYTAQREKGKFTYTREFIDSTGNVKDVLTNSGFVRSIDGNPISLTEEWENKYSNSVNSVVYFALLPFPLNDPAVKKELLKEDTLNGKPYHRIKVTFTEDGGGEDYSDNFVYWISKDTYQLDYLAYDYQTEGGGSRFRAAHNPRRIGGILFQDYSNLEPVQEASLEDYARLHMDDKLKKVSDINLENIEVRPL